MVIKSVFNVIKVFSIILFRLLPLFYLFLLFLALRSLEAFADLLLLTFLFLEERPLLATFLRMRFLSTFLAFFFPFPFAFTFTFAFAVIFTFIFPSDFSCQDCFFCSFRSTMTFAILCASLTNLLILSFSLSCKVRVLLQHQLQQQILHKHWCSHL